jgi:hypothetical protein
MTTKSLASWAVFLTAAVDLAGWIGTEFFELQVQSEASRGFASLLMAGLLAGLGWLVRRGNRLAIVLAIGLSSFDVATGLCLSTGSGSYGGVGEWVRAALLALMIGSLWPLWKPRRMRAMAEPIGEAGPGASELDNQEGAGRGTSLIRPRTRTTLAAGVTAISHTFFVLALGGAGLLLGGLMGIRRAEGLSREEPWRPLGSPPTRVTRLLRIDADGAYVAASDDQVYKCCWEPSELRESPSYPSSHFPCEGDQDRPTAPGKVIDQQEVAYCGPDYGISYALVLLDDGSVWEWSYASNPLAGIGILLSYALAGIASGFLLGGSIAIWSWRRRWRKWKQPPQEQGSGA